MINIKKSAALIFLKKKTISWNKLASGTLAEQD